MSEESLPSSPQSHQPSQNAPRLQRGASLVAIPEHASPTSCRQLRRQRFAQKQYHSLASAPMDDTSNCATDNSILLEEEESRSFRPIRPAPTKKSGAVLRSSSSVNSSKSYSMRPIRSSRSYNALQSSHRLYPMETKTSLTAETAELLGTPTPLSRAATPDPPPAFPSPTTNWQETETISHVMGNLFQYIRRLVAWILHPIGEFIKSLIQPRENRLALRLFGSLKALEKEKKRCQKEAPYLIHPYSTFRFVWDFLMLIILFGNLIILPVYIAFFQKKSDTDKFWAIFNLVNDSIFLTDVLLNFNTGIAQQHMAVQVTLDRKIIVRSYLTGWFCIDLISSIPMDTFAGWFGDDNSINVLGASKTLKILRIARFLSLMKLLRVSRLMRYATQWEDIFNLASAFIRIFNLIFMMVLISHWNGCLMFLLPSLFDFPQGTWVKVDEIEDDPWYEQYSWALFRAMSHMLCIGYGQTAPRTMMDLWLVIISMLSGATCYALFIGHATNMIQQFDSSRRQFTEKIQQVEEYMAHRKLPPELQVRVHEYYEYKFKGKMFDEEIILEELNDCLRDEILNYNCRELVNVVPFFQGADSVFVSGIVSKLQYEVYQPGDYIIVEGTIGDKMYFIQQGNVEVITSEGVSVAQLGDGSYFGEICLLAKIKRTANIRAESYCNLYCLLADDFNEVLSEFPEMRKVMEDVARERLNKLGREVSVLDSGKRDADAKQAQEMNEKHKETVQSISNLLKISQELPTSNCSRCCCACGKESSQLRNRRPPVKLYTSDTVLNK